MFCSSLPLIWNAISPCEEVEIRPNPPFTLLAQQLKANFSENLFFLYHSIWSAMWTYLIKKVNLASPPYPGASHLQPCLSHVMVKLLLFKTFSLICFKCQIIIVIYPCTSNFIALYKDWSKLQIQPCLYILISSPELCSGWAIVITFSPSVNIFKRLLLWSRWANFAQISYGASLGWENERLLKWSRSVDQDGRHAHIW